MQVTDFVRDATLYCLGIKYVICVLFIFQVFREIYQILFEKSILRNKFFSYIHYV